MKLLHTADWHLCDYLHGHDRTPHLRERVAKVAALCDEHTVDVLVIAGDLFSDHSAVTVEKMTAELDFLRTTFEPFFKRGGTILAVTGNHDRDSRMDFLRASMRLASVGGSELTPGRMYLQNRRAFTTLNGVQFALVPYPFLPRYSNPDDDFKSAEEANRMLVSRVAEWVQELPRRDEYDKTKPGVLIAHLHIRGAEAHSLYKLTEKDDVCFDAAFIPAHWAYVALGHIHKPQLINNCSHIRYPGPLDRLDFGEMANQPGVVLFDIGPGGLVGTPLTIPLEPTPMYDSTIDDWEDFEEELAGYPERATALTRMTVKDAGSASRWELERKVRKHFPYLCELRYESPVQTTVSRDTPKAKADYRETVRDYLQKQLAEDADAGAVLALAESFLAGGAS